VERSWSGRNSNEGAIERIERISGRDENKKSRTFELGIHEKVERAFQKMGKGIDGKGNPPRFFGLRNIFQNLPKPRGVFNQAKTVDLAQHNFGFYLVSGFSQQILGFYLVSGFSSNAKQFWILFRI